jgi:transcriptional antiterminator NusG
MIGKQEENFTKVDEKYLVGEEVVIIDGPFTEMKATIEKIEDRKITLVVSIFGRKTPVVLDINQITKK